MKEKISALMDGDLALEDAEYLMTAMKAKGEAAQAWSTYHLIGDVMRDDPALRADLTSRIMKEVANQPAVLAPKASLLQAKRPMLWSVAASVAGVFFVGWMVLHNQVQDGLAPVEIAQNVPSEYLLAHQSMAPTNAAYFIQPASYTQGE
jgi:sigma-E factor negative regulatory protein RseA